MQPKSFKAMSQIGTTIEQSKRLMTAGLAPKSADMKWTNVEPDADGGGYYLNKESNEYHLEVGQPYFDLNDDSIPAWSLSALWDLLNESKITLEYATNRSSEALIESIVTAVERFAKQGRI